MDKMLMPLPDRAELPTVTSTELRDFGRVRTKILGTAAVAVTVHGNRDYIIVRGDEYDRLRASLSQADNAVIAQFDQMIAQMQTPEAAAAADSLFDATPRELSEAHRKATRRRKAGV